MTAWGRHMANRRHSAEEIPGRRCAPFGVTLEYGPSVRRTSGKRSRRRHLAEAVPDERTEQIRFPDLHWIAFYSAFTMDLTAVGYTGRQRADSRIRREQG